MFFEAALEGEDADGEADHGGGGGARMGALEGLGKMGEGWERRMTRRRRRGGVTKRGASMARQLIEIEPRNLLKKRTITSSFASHLSLHHPHDSPTNAEPGNHGVRLLSFFFSSAPFTPLLHALQR